MCNSPFESSLFMSAFDFFMEDIDLVYNNAYYYFLLFNNNTMNIVIILFFIPVYVMYLYSNSLINSFFFKNYVNVCYRVTYDWSYSYVQYCKFFMYPFIMYLFSFLLLSNLIGMMPFNFAITSHLSLTFLLSFTVWYTTVSLCFYYQSLEFLEHFLIKGMPNWLVPILLIIELLSYCMSAISLSLRLFANMFSGHMLLHVVSSGLYEFMFSYTTGLLFLKFLTSMFSIFIFSILVIFEMLVGLLQAYIFTLLSLIYLSDV